MSTIKSLEDIGDTAIRPEQADRATRFIRAQRFPGGEEARVLMQLGLIPDPEMKRIEDTRRAEATGRTRCDKGHRDWGRVPGERQRYCKPCKEARDAR